MLMADYNISNNYFLYKGWEQQEKIDILHNTVKETERISNLQLSWKNSIQSSHISLAWRSLKFL